MLSLNQCDEPIDGGVGEFCVLWSIVSPGGARVRSGGTDAPASFAWVEGNVEFAPPVRISAGGGVTIDRG